MKTTNKRKMLALICSLVLLVGLITVGAVISFADTTPHTHKLCGESTCTHAGSACAGDITYTELTQTMLDSTKDVGYDKYVIPAGNYCLSENLTAAYPIHISENVNICLNGKTFDVATKGVVISGGITNICDCSEQETGAFKNSSISANGGNLNIYGGTFSRAGTVVTVTAENYFNMYGGTLISNGTGSKTNALVAHGTAKIYNGSLTASGYAIYSALNSTVTVEDGTFKSTGLSTVLTSSANTVLNGGTFICESQENQVINVQASASLTINGGTYLKSDGVTDRTVVAYGTLIINGAPTFNKPIEVTLGVNEFGNSFFDVSGYTGMDKLLVCCLNGAQAVENGILAKGSADKLLYTEDHWTLVDGVDDSSPANAVAKLKKVTSHNVCGESSCTHAGAACSAPVEYTALTSTMYTSLPTVSLGSSESPITEFEFYVIPAGNYYLTGNINETGYYALIEGDVNLCLNGYTLNTAGIYVRDGTVNICDCTALEKGAVTTTSRFYIGNKVVEDGKNPVVNFFSGNFAYVSNYTGVFNKYGGRQDMTDANAIVAYAPSVTNIYGGEIISSAKYNINLVPDGDKTVTLNIYGGTFVSDIRNVNVLVAKSSTFENGITDINISGGSFSVNTNGYALYASSLASYTNKVNVNIDGGEYTTKDDNSIKYHLLRFAGYVDVNITKMKADTKASVISYDPMVNITLDPENDEDIDFKSAKTTVYNHPLDNVDIKNAEGEAVTPADYGKLIIKGGTFNSLEGKVLSNQRAYTVMEIYGGVFTGASGNSTVLIISNPDSEIYIYGGSFDANAFYIRGKLVIAGAPTITAQINLHDIIVNDAGEYILDFSGYTGENKIKLGRYTTTSVQPTHDLIWAKGSADKIESGITGWRFTDGFDAAEPANAVVKLVHAAHQGTATCTVAAECSICLQQYTLAHTYGEWHGEIPATCMAEGTKGYQTCSVCTFNYDAEDNKIDDLNIAINPDAHAYGEVTYTWADGSIKCTATRVCSHNHEHIDSESVDPVVTTVQSTCTEAGKTTYAATFTNSAFAPQTKEDTIAALGHEFVNMQSDKDGHWLQCNRCTETEAKTEHTYEDGICTVCKHEKPGLPTGAIVGIVIGSAAVVGIGGFAIFWFIIKKKSWADLLTVFKKK